MFNFRKITLNDKDWISECVAQGDTDGCCFSFGNLFTWGESFSLEIAEFDGFCLMRGKDSYGTFYTFPSGKGNIKNAVSGMMKEAQTNGEIFRLCHLLESNITVLEEHFPGVFDFTFNRDLSEYVYSVKNMADLPGKKFHGKKGHVNAFFRKHDNVYCDPITDDNIHLCLEIAKKWMTEKDDSNGELQKEYHALETSVKHFKALGYIGAILYADDIPVAFTMGESLKNNTFCTHFEKTIPDYKDAFPVINNGFTKLMLTSFDYVNREEDTGIEGLRKAKLSYYPEFLLDKYSAVMKNDPSRKYYADASDFSELKQLWKSVFGDSDDIIDFFFENALNPENIYAFRKNGKIVSAFYLIDSSIVCRNEKFSVKYLYAAATLPEYRGQGIMTKMINDVASELKSKDIDALFLYPAEDLLYNFYEKIGFKSIFIENYYNFDKDSISKYKNTRYFNTTSDYHEMREYIPAECFAQFDSGYLDFARFCAKKSGFELSVVFDDEDKVFIIGTKKDKIIYLDEAISMDGNYNHILSVLSDIRDADEFVLKTPVCIELDVCECEKQSSGMLLPLRDDIWENKIIYLGQPCM